MCHKGNLNELVRIKSMRQTFNEVAGFSRGGKKEGSPRVSKEDLLIIYQTYCEDIRHAKNQQWAITNYVLLLMAGIIGFYQYVHGIISPIGEIILVLAALIIAVLGTFVVIKYQYLRLKYGRRIDKQIKLHLSREAQRAFDRPNLKKECFFDLFLNTFLFTQWAGAFFVNWIVEIHIPGVSEVCRNNVGFIVQIAIYASLCIGLSTVFYRCDIKRRLEDV